MIVAGLIATGCGGIVDPSKNTVEPFSGTLQAGESRIHGFTASKNGEISVKVTALSPVSNTFLSLTWAQAGSDGGCTTSIGGIFQQNSFAQLNIPALTGQIQKGPYCLLVQDVIGFSTPENYTVTVSHP